MKVLLHNWIKRLKLYLKVMGAHFEGYGKKPCAYVILCFTGKVAMLIESQKSSISAPHLSSIRNQLPCVLAHQIMTFEILPGCMKTNISPLLSTLDFTSDQYIGCIIRNSLVQLEIVLNQ